MSDLFVNVRRRIFPSGLRRRLRREWYRVRPPRIEVGVGRGLRFDPGPGNVEYARGSNELPVQHALAERTVDGSIVFDIGANVGFFTVLAAQLTGPGGTVVAFEPVDTNAAYIRRNAQLNGLANVVVVEKAVSDSVGTADLTLARFSGGAVLSEAGRPPDPADTITVDVVTIDHLVEGGEVPVPTLIKIDVEGAELEVLRGMSRTLTEHRPTVICEVDDATEPLVAEKLTSCIDFIRSLDYEVAMLDDSYVGAGWVVRHFVATHGE